MNPYRQVTDRYDYGAWGETYHLAGTTIDNPYQYVGELGYYHHWQSPDLANMLHLGVRFYEPEVGRFSQMDPTRDGRNWYAYVYGKPTRYVDPTGLWGTIDFVRHYYLGFGKPIDLANVGLLGTYQMAMSAQVSRFRDATMRRLKEAAGQQCQRTGGKSKITVVSSHELHEEEHVREHNERNPFDPLYSIGGHVFDRISSCKAVADCCQRTMTYKCTYHYGFDDRFSDPLSFEGSYGSRVEVPLPILPLMLLPWPYDITASWEVKLSGSDRF